MAALKLAAVGSVLVAAVAIGSCSAPNANGSENIVFSVAAGFRQGAHNSTIDLVDIGLPPMRNLTDRRVRVQKISLVSVPTSVRLISVTAHTGAAVGIVDGDLTKLCRDTYPSYPVSDAVTAAHAESNWNLVLAIAFTRPGQYYLRQVKIYYTTNGQNGWQYQNLFTTLYIKAARPGDKPGFAGCP